MPASPWIAFSPLVALTAALCATLAPALAGADRGDAAATDAGPWAIADYHRRTLYHAAQSPGYTCWTVLSRAPDGGALLAFVEESGPVQGRAHAPEAVARHMPPLAAGYDMTGLDISNVLLASADGGWTWSARAREHYRSCMNGSIGGGLVALSDGTLLRTMWGQDLPYDTVAPTGFVQRSGDGGRTWGAPEYLGRNDRLQTWPKRMRRLRDGRVVICGAAEPYDPRTWTWGEAGKQYKTCYWVSDGPRCRAWTGPVFLASAEPIAWYEEWDVAELPDGALLAVVRGDHARGQCLLAKRGDGWSAAPIARAPFPDSGEPELLATREGPVLHIASNGIWGTRDRGASWQLLQAVPAGSWYPSAMQRDDGLILVASHLGGDDPYGAVDQKILLDTFRLDPAR